jgi:molecular chaperone DnaJ
MERGEGSGGGFGGAGNPFAGFGFGGPGGGDIRWEFAGGGGGQEIDMEDIMEQFFGGGAGGGRGRGAVSRA